MKPASPEQAVFAEALLRPTPEARVAYLDGTCGVDTPLRRRVESLLRAADKAGDFLEEPPTGLTGGIGKTMILTVPSEKPGDCIGRYKLLQQIGEGGCGVVYMAEQEEPVRRRVALKVIKLGMDTKEVIARFEAERQALALMDHPNIAKVLDAGATETGRPYFVMELVRGIKITDYCDQNNLPTEERLKLFTQVCQAIQHAHQKGIIHRDIKPSNILVTISDPGSPGCPKVIDFGIAKATTGQRLTDKTVFTAFEQFIGTPAYMSPEQAMMTSLDIDTRTDIYALGVLLYELLTGRTPFDAKELMAGGLDAMRRIILEQEPSRPSTRLSTLLAADLTAVASHRHAEPSRLGTLLRGDLDWIVMKALEKDRTRRYETANGLAADVQRHLDNEPVIARPPSSGYRFQKMVRRNKLAFAAASAVATALVLGLGVSTWMFFKERQAHQRAAAAEQDQARLRSQAEAQAAKSQRESQFLRDTVYSLYNVLRDRAGLQNILDTTAARIGTELKQQPEVAAELSMIIGGAYGALGNYADAERMFREALALYQKLPGNENRGFPSLLGRIASMASFQGRHAESETLGRESLALFKKLKDEEDPQVAYALDRLAEMLLRQGQTIEVPANQGLLKEAETLEREALRLQKKLFGDKGSDYASSLGNLALILSEQGKPGEAATMLREVLATHRKLHRDDHWGVAMDLIDLGDALVGDGKFDEADPFLQEGLAMRRRLFNSDHPKVAEALRHLANLRWNQGRLAEAEQALQEARGIYSKVRTYPVPDMIATLDHLVRALRGQDKLAEAETFQREKLTEERKLHGDDSALVANDLAQLTSILIAEEKFADAEPPARECLSIREKKLPDDWRTFNARSLLGGTLLGQKKFPEAEPLLLSGFEGLKQREEKIPAAGNRYVKESLQRLVQLYEATNQSEKAAEWNGKLAEFQKAEDGKKAAAKNRSMCEVTRILTAIEQGDAKSTDELLPVVYNELRRLAAHKMANEPAGHTLQPTALVHEAWLKLVDSPAQSWQNRAHFFGAAAEAMRRILIDRARRKGRQRRGSGAEHLDADALEIASPAPDDQLLALNDALDRFAALEPQQAELVKLRYFVGLKIEEAAEVLGVSEATAKRWWAYARAWLFSEIGARPEQDAFSGNACVRPPIRPKDSP